MRRPQKSPIIYLPIEVKTRELDSRLLLTIELLQCGFNVVLGVGHEIIHRLHQLPKGIVLVKGITPIEVELMREIRSHDHDVIAIDEEAFGICDQHFMNRYVSNEVAGVPSLIFCQSPAHRRFLATMRSVPEHEAILTGNPREDLLRGPFQSLHNNAATELRAKHGPFILINTNSGDVNSKWGGPERYRQILDDIGLGHDKSYVEASLQLGLANMKAIEALIREVARRAPRQRIFLRPHPSENHERWVEFQKAVPSLNVVLDSDTIPWCLAAEITVVTGCTTGTEAVLLGQEAINMIVRKMPQRFGNFLVDHVCLLNQDPKETAQLALDYIAGKKGPFAESRASRLKAVSEHLLGENSGFAFRNIAAAIDEIAPRNLDQPDPDQWIEAPILQEKPPIHQTAWEKAYARPEDVGARLNRLLEALQQPFEGTAKRVGYGMLFFSVGNPS